MDKIYKINGMSCSVCAAHVEKAASAVDGVLSASVNLTANTLRVSWDESKCSEKDIALSIKKAGYKMIIEKGSSGGTDDDKAVARQKAGLIASVVLLLVLVYVAMGHMIKLPLPDIVGHGTFGNCIAQLVLCVPVIVINFRFFKRGIPLLFKGQPNMDTLISVGSGSAFIYSLFATVTAAIPSATHHNVYYETAAMILTFVSVGKYLEARAKAKTGTALEKLTSMIPAEAELVEGDIIKTVPAESLKAGDIILVREGVSIPADGIVINGSGIADESGLTGESLPVEKTEGDSVKAGTINLNGVFRMKVVSSGGDTVISKMVALVQDAAATKAPIASLADKVSSVFVPAVMSIALITGIVWFFITKDFEIALKMCVTVLVVSCPCSLGLATPVAVTAAIYKSAEHGILVKSAEAFELLEKADTVVLDKTGTITEGRPSVQGVISYSEKDDNEIIRIAASLEKASNHPFAEAFVAEADDRAIVITPADDYENTPGRGISGTVSGKKFYIGNIKFANEVLSEKLPENIVVSSENEASKGNTPLLLFSEDAVLGCVLVADTVKAEAAAFVSELKKRGKGVVMLTGDNEKTAAAIASKAGIETFRAGVFPHEKEEYIRYLIQDGRKPIMVGDGINDSAALTSAHLGIAMGSGTDIAIESADCVLLKDSLSDLLTLLDTSKFALRIIKQNLFWALFYNCLCIPLAAGVLVPVGISFSPMFASAAMSLSSLFVVTNALRIMKK